MPELSRRDLLKYTGVAGLAAAAATTLPGWIGTAAAASSFSPVRPPAVPLAVRSMYLSAWQPSDNLAGAWSSFWTGHVNAMCGIVRIDGTAYLFAGAPSSPTLNQLPQTSLTVTATRSTYVFTGAGIRLTVEFFTPVDPDSLQRQCTPMSYLTVSAVSSDGAAHRVSVYYDISGEWAHGNVASSISWGQQTVGSQVALTFQPSSPSVLAEYGDQASWGTVVFAADAGATWQIAADATARANGAAGTLPNTADTRQPRAINDAWPVFAFNRDLGSVTTAGATATFVLGHVRTPAVSYLGTNLDPWWRTYWPTWQAMLTWVRNDYPLAYAQGQQTDARINDDVQLFFGSNTTTAQHYAALCALALRQAFAGTELVNRGGKPWAMLKEISSNGDFSTVDVMYPAAPAYLYLSPDYLKLLLEPLLSYVEEGHWPQPFAPHDLGVYPNAFGHDDGGGENMEVEESANMLIMAAAVADRLAPADATAWVASHYSTLRGWAEYLVGNALDPGYQNQTDDFTGFIAHSSNLALKGIVGIGAMGQLAQLQGNTADQTRYFGTAQSYITQWVSNSQDSGGQHLKLAYDQNGTWSLKYNGYPDKLLGLGLVPDAVATEEAAWYPTQADAYGVELDPRHTYTKADWELWTAAFLANHASTRDLLVDRVWTYANSTTTRVPFSDWYDTVTGRQSGFQARPVVGGTYAMLTLRHTPRGLTGRWSLAGTNTAITDTSGNGRNLARSGGTASAARQVVRTDRSFTVAARVNLASTGGFATAVSQDGVQASGFFLQYSGADNRWAFTRASSDTANTASTRALSTAAPAVNTWTHLVGVYDVAAGQLRLYVNGVRQSSVAYGTGWLAAGPFQVGRGKWNGAAADPWRGSIDEVRTYDYAASDAQAASLFHQRDNLVASYELDEGTGTTAADAIGGHTATLAGGAGWTGGFAGRGLALNGTTSYADTGAALVSTTAAFSVSAWARLDRGGAFGTVVSQDGNQASGFFLQYSGADNRWAFSRTSADTTGPGYTRALSATAPVLGRWTHLTGVWDGTRLSLYVDGRLSGSAAYSGAWAAAGHTIIGRGKFNGAAVDFFPGAIDGVRVYGRALSATDAAVLL